jgi:serine/threonine protein kinase
LNFLQGTNIHTIGNYKLGKTLGEGILALSLGSFGIVKLAYHTLTNQKVAIKIVDKIHAPQLVREIETWRQFDHPNIVRLYEVLTSETKIYMVTEYCTGGEMLDYITKNGKLDEKKIDTKRIFYQIVEAVAHCHTKNFVHRCY